MISIVVMLKAAPPVFSRDRLLAALLVNNAWLPKVRLVGEKVTEGLEAQTPLEV